MWFYIPGVHYAPTYYAFRYLPCPSLGYAASLQWNQQTTLTTQTITALTAGSTVPLGRQLAALQHPVVLPERIASGKRCALALAFPCKPFYSLGDSHA